MRDKLFVLLGDVVASRKIREKENFQKKLISACEKVNSDYLEDLYAELKILKGKDEIGGVLLYMSNIFHIISTIQSEIHPQLMRFVLVFDHLDTALNTRDTAKMDGPAFYKASEIMGDLKKSNLMFDMMVGDTVIDTAISNQINLILLLKKDWTQRQHQIVQDYEKTGNQYETAKNLNITQQSISKTLSRLMWSEIKIIEEKLNYIINNYAQKGEHRGDLK
ncbi:MAG: SatD family protein [Archaeoglobaceae archaeon]